MAATVPPDLPPSTPIEPGWTPPPPTAPTAVAPLPWEQPGYPALEALFETAKLLLLRPGEAFSRMSTTGDIGRPLLFAVVLGWLGMIAAQLYQLAMPGIPWRYLPGMGRGMDYAVPFAYTLAMMVLAPLLILLGVFIWSAILHLFLMLAGGANGGFSATVRVVCYAGVCQVLQVLPLCGGIIAFLWSIVIEIVGLAAAHRTSQGRAAVAVFLPLALCCACAAVIAVAFGAAILALVGASR
jgi:hypothetical protein